MEDRMTRMEVKIAYMEETIATLDSVVTEQGKQMTLLLSRLGLLEKRLAELGDHREGDVDGQAKPPHY
jgi:SlyX protein